MDMGTHDKRTADGPDSVTKPEVWKRDPQRPNITGFTGRIPLKLATRKQNSEFDENGQER